MTALVGVQPALIEAERKLAALAAARGWAYTVNAEEGGGFVRTQADTARYMGYRAAEYAQYVAALKKSKPGAVPLSIYAWRPIAAFGSSYHNYGAAFDITPVRGTFAQIGSLAPAAGLRWGGSASFVNVGRTDPPHFELPISLLEAKARWLAAGRIAGGRSVSPAVQLGAVLLVALLAGIAHYKGYHA